MKNFAAVCIITFLAAAVPAAAETPLYSWYDYQDDAYRYMKKGDSASMANLMKSYEQIIRRQNGLRRTVPPGIYADYGWLLIKSGRTQDGIAMLRKEMELYPESAVLMQRMLKRYESTN